VAVAEDVALAGHAALGGKQLAGSEPGRVDQPEPAWRQHRHRAAPAVEQRPQQGLLQRRRVAARPGSVDRGRVHDHQLDAGLGGGRQRELLGALLGALVRGALRVVRQRGLVEGRARLGVEDVDRRCVHHPPRAGLGRGADHRLGAASVDAVEDRRVCNPLLRQPHRVEHQLAAPRRSLHGRRLGHVAPDRLDAGGEHAGRAPRIAHQRPHVVAALHQGTRRGVPDLAGGSGDERAHWRGSYV
jgi:hypothetical protein